MNTQKMNESLASLAAKMIEGGADVIALASVTAQAATEWDALAASAQAKADALRDALTANAPLIAGACLVRGEQAAIARGIAGEQATKTEQNTATKRVGRIASVGRLMVAHPKADVLALYTFVNGATKADIDAACEAKADPTKAPARKRGTAGPKAPKGPRKVRDLVEPWSRTTKAVTDAVVEHGTKDDQEQAKRVLLANLKRIDAALASGVHGDGVIPAATPAEQDAQTEQAEQETDAA